MTYVPPNELAHQTDPNADGLDLAPLSFLTNCEHTRRHLKKERCIRHFGAGEALKLCGRCQHRVYTILRRTAFLGRSFPDGRTQILRVLMPTDLEGRLGFETTRNDTKAMSDVTSDSISRHGLKTRSRISPEIARRLLLSILREFAEARDWLPMLGRKTSTEKLASFRLELLRRSQNYGPSTVRQPLWQFQLANLLGLTHKTISRQFANLRYHGVVDCLGPREIELPGLGALVVASGSDIGERNVSCAMP